MNKFIPIIFLMFNLSVVFSQNKLTHEVYFDTDKYIVPSTEKTRLLLFISTITNLDIESISVYGFCDDRGANSYNLKLSRQRAHAIKEVFENNHLSEGLEDLITSIDGKGEILLKIVKDKSLLKIRGLNRKVEIIVNPKLPKTNKSEKDTVKRKTVQQKLKSNLKAGDKIVVDNLLFVMGHSYVTPESKKRLEAVAEILVERKNIYFTIQGHVCCTKDGRDAVDRRTKKRNLSETRAKYVYDYFVKKGIDKKRMRHVGLRRKFPLGGDPKLDRRVELLITHIGRS